MGWFSSLFGKKEVFPYAKSKRYSENLSQFPKWITVTARHDLDMQQKENIANDNFQQWLQFIEGIRDKSRSEQIELVNNWVNNIPFHSDIANWQEKDHWATPQEFLAQGGDCEDFSTAKYMSLKMLGHNVEDMRLVVLDDKRLRKPHAVLAVDMEGKTCLLDNQIKHVLEPDAAPHYAPIYALNEKGWWRS